MVHDQTCLVGTWQNVPGKAIAQSVSWRINAKGGGREASKQARKKEDTWFNECTETKATQSKVHQPGCADGQASPATTQGRCL